MKAVEGLSPNPVALDPDPLNSTVTKVFLSLTCFVLSVHVLSPAIAYRMHCRGGTELSLRPRPIVLGAIHKDGEK